MNGTTLTLGLVGALAAAGALGRRGSRSLDLPYRRRAEFDELADEFRSVVNGREDTRKEEEAFARRHGLVLLGRGYARTVFRVPEGALKIEMGWQPFTDNRAEADLWAQAPADLAENLVPVLAHAHDHGWLLMPEVEVGGEVRAGARDVLEACGLGDFMYHESNVAKDGRLVDYAFVTQEAWRERCMKRGREQRDLGARARRVQQDDRLLRQGSRAKAKPPTLAQRGMPTTWFHGTKFAFTGPLKPNKGMGGACIWLADREGAAAYGPRLIRVELDPSTRVVDLSDVSDPAVLEFIRRDASASNMYWLNREDVTAEQMAQAVEHWRNRATHYDAIEARGWAKAYFRKAGVDALLVRDVKGWSGRQSMPSLCVLNRAKISSQRAQGSET